MAAGEAPIGPETLGDPEAAKVEQWWQPWPELLLPAPRLETANQLASVIDPETLNAPEVTERIEWWAPWSEPVPPLAAVAYSAAQAASGAAPQGQETLGDPEEAKQAHWWRTWPELLLPHAGVFYTAAQAASGPAPQDQETLGDPEQPKLEHWWQRWSEPRWELLSNAYAAAQSTIATRRRCPRTCAARLSPSSRSRLATEKVRRVSTRRFDLFYPETGPIRRAL